MTQMGDSAGLAQAIMAGIDSAVVNLHTWLPGVVQTFYATEQEADVQVRVRRIMRDLAGNERLETVPILARAPVWMPRAGGFSVSLPVTAGDECAVLFAERDISAWLADGGLHAPASRRRHDFSDAIVLPGLTSSGNRLATYSTDSLQIRSDDDSQVVELAADGSIRIEADTIRLGSSVTDVIAELEALLVTLFSAQDTAGLQFNSATKALIEAHRVKIDALKT